MRHNSFEELLRKSNECTIHIKNLKKLMLEVYKCLRNENPSFMWNMFHEKSIQYNLRSKNLLMLPQTNTIEYGNDSIVFRGSISWNYLPNEIKSQASVYTCKKCIKSWSGGDCNCKICNCKSCHVHCVIFALSLFFFCFNNFVVF